MWGDLVAQFSLAAKKMVMQIEVSFDISSLFWTPFSIFYFIIVPNAGLDRKNYVIPDKQTRPEGMKGQGWRAQRLNS